MYKGHHLYQDVRWYFLVSYVVKECIVVYVFTFCSWEIFDFFSISPDIVSSPKISVVPFLHFSLFCSTGLLSALLVFSVRIYWISFLVLICSSVYFTNWPTSFAGQFFVFELQGDFCLEGLSITTSKSTPDGLLEKLSTASLLTGVPSSRIFREEFFLLLIRFQLNWA